MPAPFAVKNARLRVSSTSGGAYALIGTVTGWQPSGTTEGAARDHYLGGVAITLGEPTESGTINVFYDRGDTTGQGLLRSAYRTGASVFLQICPEGTGTGKKVDQYEIKVTGMSGPTGEAGPGNKITDSFSYEVVPDTYQEVTLA